MQLCSHDKHSILNFLLSQIKKSEFKVKRGEYYVLMDDVENQCSNLRSSTFVPPVSTKDIILSLVNDFAITIRPKLLFFTRMFRNELFITNLEICSFSNRKLHN